MNNHQRRQRASEAFILYDFGQSVVQAGPWEFDGDVVYRKITFNDSDITFVFVVRFIAKTNEVEEAYVKEE